MSRVFQLGAFLVAGSGLSAASGGDAVPRLAEIRIDSLPPALNFEYVEVVAATGSELADFSIVVIGDEGEKPGPALGNSGVVESAIPLVGAVVPEGHCLLVHEGSGPVRADLVADLRLEDLDNLTVLLVRGNLAEAGDDLDLDDDGVLDFEPWQERIDGVAFVWSSPGVASEHVYSEVRVGPLGGWFIFGARRCLDTDQWIHVPFGYPGPAESAGVLNLPCHGAVCEGDLDTDGTVGSADLAILLANWERIGAIGDLDGNGRVEAADLARLLSRWGPCEL